MGIGADRQPRSRQLFYPCVGGARITKRLARHVRRTWPSLCRCSCANTSETPAPHGGQQGEFCRCKPLPFPRPRILQHRERVSGLVHCISDAPDRSAHLQGHGRKGASVTDGGISERYTTRRCCASHPAQCDARTVLAPPAASARRHIPWWRRQRATWRPWLAAKKARRRGERMPKLPVSATISALLRLSRSAAPLYRPEVSPALLRFSSARRAASACACERAASARAPACATRWRRVSFCRFGKNPTACPTKRDWATRTRPGTRSAGRSDGARSAASAGRRSVCSGSKRHDHLQICDKIMRGARPSTPRITHLKMLKDSSAASKMARQLLQSVAKRDGAQPLMCKRVFCCGGSRGGRAWSQRRGFAVAHSLQDARRGRCPEVSAPGGKTADDDDAGPSAPLRDACTDSATTCCSSWPYTQSVIANSPLTGSLNTRASRGWSVDDDRGDVQQKVVSRERRKPASAGLVSFREKHDTRGFRTSHSKAEELREVSQRGDPSAPHLSAPRPPIFRAARGTTRASPGAHPAFYLRRLPLGRLVCEQRAHAAVAIEEPRRRHPKPPQTRTAW